MKNDGRDEEEILVDLFTEIEDAFDYFSLLATGLASGEVDSRFSAQTATLIWESLASFNDQISEWLKMGGYPSGKTVPMGE